MLKFNAAAHAGMHSWLIVERINSRVRPPGWGTSTNAPPA
jgi:hypothetical protein